jgi:hypothetical protein
MFFVGARLQKKFPGRRADERTGIFLYFVRFRSISLPHYYISISVFSQKNGALKSGDAIPADLSFTKEEQ